MTAIGVYQILFFFAVDPRADQAARPVHGAGVQGERTFLHPVLRPLERSSTG